MRWSDLEPDAGFLEALAHAGPRDESADQNTKRGWSERFANGCAIWIANAFRVPQLAKKRILPLSLEAGTEPFTPLGAGTSKRIDVTVADPVAGLEIGVSLKGLNFRDGRSGNFDKNLTGRLYELGDEVRLVHEHLPLAFMAGIFFLPLEAAIDKTDAANSSFANTVAKLRERTGRLDPTVMAHSARCDAGFVALYAHSDADGIRRGVVRFFDVASAPPRRGRPQVGNTMGLDGLAAEVLRRATRATAMEWGEAEPD